MRFMKIRKKNNRFSAKVWLIFRKITNSDTKLTIQTAKMCGSGPVPVPERAKPILQHFGCNIISAAHSSWRKSKKQTIFREKIKNLENYLKKSENVLKIFWKNVEKCSKLFEQIDFENRENHRNLDKFWKKYQNLENISHFFTFWDGFFIDFQNFWCSGKRRCPLLIRILYLFMKYSSKCAFCAWKPVRSFFMLICSGKLWED